MINYNPINDIPQEYRFSEEKAKNVKYFCRMHIDLHGTKQKRSYENIFADIKKNSEIQYSNDDICFLMDYIDFYYRECIREKKVFGVFLGRCQPFSNAHNEIIQEMIRDGVTPVIILGSINKNDDRNPLTFEERRNLIKIIYPRGVVILGLEDKDNWEDWMDSVIELFDKNKMNKNNITLYSHIKDVDRTDFKYRGTEYKSESYTKMFELNRISIKNIDEKTCFLGNVIHASDIRKDEEVAKRNLDARIYVELKNKFNWWK